MKKLLFKDKILKSFIWLLLVLLPIMAATSVYAVVDEEIEVVARKPVSQAVEGVPQQEIPIANVTPAKTPGKHLEEIPDLQPEKQPRGILFKFAIAILWVVISSLIIYFSLISYKRFSGKTNFGINVEENTLNAPKNFKEAINLFLKKTKE